MRSPDVGFIIFVSIFFLIGFGLLGWGLYTFCLGRQALSWPTANGRLLECRLQENPDGEGPTWEVKVRYRYSFDRREFEGDRVAFGYSNSAAPEEHQPIYDKLRGASQVMVRYDPHNPSRSVLAAGFNRSTLTTLVFAIVWLVFTTGVTILWTLSSVPDTRIPEQIQVIE